MAVSRVVFEVSIAEALETIRYFPYLYARKSTSKIMKFEELGLHEDILEGIRPMNFDQMTPVQEQTIPVIMEGRDLIGCAQTGTGKTAAYTLPLLERLLREGNPDNVVKSLIVVPTRELAQQIDVQFQGFSYFLPLSTTVVYGGGDGFGWSEQKQGMLMGTDIVIATPAG